MRTLEKASETCLEERIVLLRLGPELCGVNVLRVGEIVRPQRTTRPPRSEIHVRSLIYFRNRTIQFVDLKVCHAPSYGATEGFKTAS